MNYASKQDMIDQYGEVALIEVTDRAEPPAGVIDDAVLEKELTNASAYIDSFISRRYALPLAVLPPALKTPCMAIAFYGLLRGRHRDEDRAAYDDARAYLRDLSSGVALLDIGGSEPKSAPAQIVAEGTDRKFSRNEKDWY